jgi:hypothetical protein
VFDYRHYVPILKGKKGEFDALRTLSPAARARLTPVIDVPPVRTNYRLNAPETTLEKHLARLVAKYLTPSWERSRGIFVDVSVCAAPDACIDGVHPLTYLLSLTRAQQLRVVPALSITVDAALRKAAALAIAQDGLGVCVRINREDCLPSRPLDSNLLELVKKLGGEVRATDLILDIRDCHEDELQRCVADVKASLLRIPRPREWRTLTFAGGAFPASLPNPPNSVEMLPRVEMTIWRALLRSARDLPRIPSFGDYGVAHPDHNEVDPRTMRMSPNIRYATDDEWIAAKGSTAKGVTVPDLCKKLVRRREYRRASFSWGDDFIATRAKGEGGPGNATTWRQVGTSHHITLAGEQASKMIAT